MSYSQGNFAYGGNGLMKTVIEKLLGAAWTITESIESSGRPGVASATLLQTGVSQCPAISVVAASASVFVDLPVCMIAGYTVKIGATTLTEGAAATGDYTVDKARGRIEVHNGGPNTGSVSFPATLTIAAGAYNLYQGWIVLHSVGESGIEDITIGLRFLGTPCTTSGVPSGYSASAPSRTGIQWAIFKSWVTGGSGSDWTVDTNRSVRNQITKDVQMAVSPTDQVNQKYFIAVNKDRIICAAARTSGEQAWVFAGNMTRLRPKEEQGFPLALLGNRSGQSGQETVGPVGDTGTLVRTGTDNVGSVYLYDVGRFADVNSTPDVACDLNANHLNQDLSTFTFSQVAGYFELWPVVPGRNNTLLADPTDRIYGICDGIMQIVKASITQEQVVTWLGDDYILLGVGGSTSRFIAIRKT